MRDDPTAVRPDKMARVRQRFLMRPAHAREYARLEHAWNLAGRPYGDFLRFMCMTFWESWEHITEHVHAWKDIYLRDRYHCASPTCDRRDLSLHHIFFIFFGGTDHPSNVLTLCSWCHLKGIHKLGAIRAEGTATDLTWKTTVLVVRGRDVLWRRYGGLPPRRVGRRFETGGG
jgi:hypothetical protein